MEGRRGKGYSNDQQLADKSSMHQYFYHVPTATLYYGLTATFSNLIHSV